jgi:hypothetical protein
MNTALPGATIPLVVRVIDDDVPANNPVTGLSCTVAVRRLADDKWYDFTANAWDTASGYGSLGASCQQALADKGDGSYAWLWNQGSADAGAENDYEMTYAVTASGVYVGRQAGEGWRFTRETAGAVWEETQAAHTTAGSMGAQVQAQAGLLATALGLLGQNQYLDQVVADSAGRMTAGRMRLYADAADVGTDNNVLATYAITATYTGTAAYAATYEMVVG